VQEWLLQVIAQYGYVGVFLLIAVENIFPPIPSEVILTFAGFMTVQAGLDFWGVAIAATAGSVVGALVLYVLGSFLNEARLEKLAAGQLGWALHMKDSDIKKAIDWFNRKGRSTVFFCRFIPIVRSLISIPAGIARMSLGLFVLFTTAGAFIWNTALLYMGRLAGNSWAKIIDYIQVYSWIALILLGLLCIGFGIYYYRKRFNKES
jgi:alkaline phosphatase